MRAFLLVLIPVLAVAASAGPRTSPPARPALTLEPDPRARFRFEGPVGERIRANTRAWLIPAPEANPGMLEMFRVRDRQPKPGLVPWAGEFAGKYLISGVQALRMDPDPELRATLARVVRDLAASQAEDGYLGPFTKAERLRGHWDLWGHYHCMLGLLMWHEQTGDAAALKTARRAADLVCATYLDTGRRVFDAGSHEMNMAVIHGLGRLYRATREPRYLRMMKEIEKDWERAGDYLREGEAGTPFFQTPRPRWESLHDLQGLIELYQITGEERYRKAFSSLWWSILRWDRRNTGGFSSGEQATGDPYEPTAIETCCTVSWQALTLDMLRLTGDIRAADELELSFYNGALGSQHPSGRWWTYSTPMDGAREASAHSIVFQARAGTPELNCCSVNGPRVLGMLSEWAVMRDPKGLAVNYFGPGRTTAPLPDGSPVTLTTQGDYPRSGSVTLRVAPQKPRSFRLRVRVPLWATNTRMWLNGRQLGDMAPGRYRDLTREWRPGDVLKLELPVSGVRVVPGAGDAVGKVSLYRGPILLAYDQALNPFDPNAVPELAAEKAASQPVVRGVLEAQRRTRQPADPWLVMRFPTAGGKSLRLCDYASAGAKGTHYRSWLPITLPLPPPAVPSYPRDGAEVPAGKLLFRWSGPSRPDAHVTEYRLQIWDTDHWAVNEPATTNRLVLSEELTSRLRPGQEYSWQVEARGPDGLTTTTPFRSLFRINPGLPRLTEAELNPPAGGLLVSAPLQENAAPSAGKLLEAAGFRREEDGLALDGQSGRLKYSVDEFPQESYTAAVRVRFASLPQGRLGQVFSAWTAPSDDPLRLVVENGRLYARIEAGGGGAGTEGFPVQTGRWYTVAGVKDGSRLLLYVDGKLVGRAPAPFTVRSRSREVALGGNPRYTGNEFLAARFADFSLHGRALSAEEIRDLFH